MTGRTGALDVAIAGDGPAGAALAAACAELGLAVEVVGRGRTWTNTYGAWVDELPGLPGPVWRGRSPGVRVCGEVARRVDRPYGVLDNDALRDHLGVERHLRRAEVSGLEERGDVAAVVLADGGSIEAPLVVDAMGADPPDAVAWQSAYGVAVDPRTARTVVDLEVATLMDWSWSGSIPGRGDVPSFLYAVPDGDRWLVEHTVLAADPVVPPESLRPALVERLGAAEVEAAEAAGHGERVVIPMGVAPRRGRGRVAKFGAASGALHPTTGYSVAASLRAAPGVAQAIAAGADVHAAIWPRPALRARALHDYGLRVLLGLDAPSTAAFFDAFFSLPVGRWAAYLRTDAGPRAVAGAMTAVFARSPWSVRRRLALADPRPLVRRPGS